jgi:hypothetical protein
VRDLTITNTGGKTGVTGLRITPLDETQTITRVDQNYNHYSNIKILSCAEGIVMKTGPKVATADSGCWYNKFFHVTLTHCTRGLWMKDTVNAGASGVNRNDFYGLRIGETGSNTGIQIDDGSTNRFFGYSAEGILTGTSPNATPTAIKIAYVGAVSTSENAYNTFFGFIPEANTRDIENNNNHTEFYGPFTSTAAKVTGTFNPRVIADSIIRSKDLTVDGDAKLGLNYGDITTAWSVFLSTGGYSGNYNGLFIASNTKKDLAQSNVALPSWALDLGGYDNPTFADADYTILLHRAAGGAWVKTLRFDPSGDIYFPQPGTGPMLTNAAGTVIKRVRLNDAGDGLIFENP